MDGLGSERMREFIYRGITEPVRFVVAEAPVRTGRDPFAGYFRVYRWERRIVVRGTAERGAWEEYKCFPRTAYTGTVAVAIIWCRLDQIPAGLELAELATLLDVPAPLSISSTIDDIAIRQFALHP